MKKLKVASLTLLLLSASLVAQATSEPRMSHARDNNGYWFDSNQKPIKSSGNKCIYSSTWNKSDAVEQCDPQYVHHPKPSVQETQAPAVTKPIKQKMTFAAGTFFDTSSYELRPSAKKVLDNLLEAVKSVNTEVAIITGYTDSRGVDYYNQGLSDTRAQSVRQYLASKGVDPNLLYAEGKGSADPVGDNKTPEGRAKNRRVDIELIGTTTRSTELAGLQTTFQDNTDTLDHGVKGK